MDLIELVRSAPWYKLIGMEPYLVEDRVVVELNISRTKHFQALGVAHGGVIASVLDSVIGLNVNKELLQRGKVAVTVQLNIHYLKPALEGKIIGEGKVVHVGSKIVVGYGEVKNSRGEVSYPALKCGASPVPPAFTADGFMREFGGFTAPPSHRTCYPMGYTLLISFPCHRKHSSFS